jgi:sugar O-acyltransferase (sialic acid O-acetyltransferase NeuD family)
MSGVLIIGAGGHAGVIAEILEANGTAILGLLDDGVPPGELRRGLRVLGPVDSFLEHGATGLILGIGSNRVRQTLVERFSHAADELWVNAIHPRAYVSPSVKLGRGIVVSPLAVIHTACTIGDHVIVNTGATVDHDCLLRNFSHICPGAHLAGHVHVEEGVLVGTGAAVVPTIEIGAWACVGAGAAVLGAVPSGFTATGVPAQSYRHEG